MTAMCVLLSSSMKGTVSCGYPKTISSIFVGGVWDGGQLTYLIIIQVFILNETLLRDVLEEPQLWGSSTLKAPLGEKIVKVSLNLIL